MSASNVSYQKTTVMRFPVKVVNNVGYTYWTAGENE